MSNDGKTMGPASAVPCPWCGKPEDFRDLMEFESLEAKRIVTCESCGREAVVVAVDTRPRVVLQRRGR